MSSENARNKFLKDCETLIKAIHANKGTKVDEAIRRQSKDGEISSSEPWCELRHYLGRLHSYREAAEVIVASTERWPKLFEDFTVVSVQSSRHMRKPIPKSELTAADIIRNMIPEEEDPRPYLSQVEVMQKLGLDKLIQDQVRRQSFRPYVHAEVLVHGHLLRRGISHPRNYWNGWKYIGSSKPTCRLCYYYFNAHQDNVHVRNSHLNLYPNWRLPDVFENEGPDAIRRQIQLMENITENVRNDAKRTLEEKRPLGKRHDSNTHSALPEYLNLSDSSSVMGSVSQARMSTSRDGHRELSTIREGSCCSLDPNEASDGSDDEGGGVPVFCR
ncbi:hypothetical protein DL764_005239 [Monosporascus ibericus]|uniref:Uncharacterized protein n=1 Tax=Monosporascus ibericus TaxID=155417 RepID=A0A4Q4T9Z2_9PEZI|nr:hypothetical protein DL764_005239 [Monosporascus ibericus]